MSVIYTNNKFENENSLTLISNRGFLYADGLFETMIHNGTEISYFKDHINRLKKGLEFFKMSLPPLFFSKLHDKINLTIKENKISGSCRVKLIVWRETGGLYTPEVNTCSYLIKCIKTNTNNPNIEKLGIYKIPLLPHSKIGNFKTLNSLYYVHAGLVKKEMNMDDIILLNTSNEICECTSSNIFWRKKNEYFTPSLQTGCIEGIMRKQFISELKNKGLKISEGNFSIEDLAGVDEFYLTNITGIRTAKTLFE